MHWVNGLILLNIFYVSSSLGNTVTYLGRRLLVPLPKINSSAQGFRRFIIVFQIYETKRYLSKYSNNSKLSHNNNQIKVPEGLVID